MPAFEAIIRENLDLLQYAAFFGGLAVFGTLELALFRQATGIARRGRWPSNFLLTILNILVLGAIPVTSLVAADVARARAWGILNDPVLPVALAFILGFAARSLVSYGIHVAMHKVPLFWRVHSVHHSDTAMDISTTVRVHPLEFLISVPIVLTAIAVLGIPPVVVIAYEVFDAGIAVFTHANVRMPRRLERWLQWIIVTPDMHRIHHSAWQPETDSNYGATLSFWDRAFGTYRIKTDDALTAMRIGLEDYRDERASSLRWLMVQPFGIGVTPVSTDCVAPSMPVTGAGNEGA